MFRCVQAFGFSVLQGQEFGVSDEAEAAQSTSFFFFLCVCVCGGGGSCPGHFKELNEVPRAWRNQSVQVISLKNPNLALEYHTLILFLLKEPL